MGKTKHDIKRKIVTLQRNTVTRLSLYLYVQEIVLALISLANHNLHRQSSKPIKLRT